MRAPLGHVRVVVQQRVPLFMCFQVSLVFSGFRFPFILFLYFQVSLVFSGCVFRCPIFCFQVSLLIFWGWGFRGRV